MSTPPAETPVEEPTEEPGGEQGTSAPADAPAAGAQPEGGRYYAITDGDPEPWALVRADGGAYYMWVGAEWVDMPYFASYFGGGEYGKREVSAEEAEGLKTTIKPPPLGGVNMLRGDGKGFPPDKPVSDDGDGGDDAEPTEEEPEEPAEDDAPEDEPEDDEPEDDDGKPAFLKGKGDKK